MRLESIAISNFRCYHEEVSTTFSNLTAFVGKNDIGKSTILEALEIFFNNDTVKIDSEDKHIHSSDGIVSITCEFSDLPVSIRLDTTATTDLKSEYLLTEAGTLKVRKLFDCGKQKVTQEVAIIAHHPTAKDLDNLLELKEKDLQALVKAKSLDVALKGNPGMRKALWAAEPSLALKEVSLSVSKAKEDTKRIWDEVENHLPIYALFQSDRKSQDSDGEVQNPMKAAVSAALAEVQDEIDAIQLKIKEKAEAIAAETHTALISLDAALAKELKPEFTPPTAAKWNGLFSINMATDGIPLNKRGSGVRRLVLVSFFRAEAQRKMKVSSKRHIIYAVEEPETSQHPNNQKLLLDALKNLSEESDCQVVLTTHSPGLASELPTDSIRFVSKDSASKHCIDKGLSVFGDIAKALGVTPDSRVRVLFCVEGPTDVIALKEFSSALHKIDPTIPDLTRDERVAFVVMGGSTLNQWVAQHYLEGLGRKQLHIYDSDVPSYEVAQATVNGRGDGSAAFRTRKLEIECYLHPDAVFDAYGVKIAISDRPEKADSVGRLFGVTYSAAQGFNGIMKEDKAKNYLARKAYAFMNAERIADRDPDGEVRGWFHHLRDMLE